MITDTEKQFCEQVCRTAAALGWKLVRTAGLGRSGFAFVGPPNGLTLRGASFHGDDARALHDACKKLSSHLQP